jgi:hypothetical protein
MRRGKQFLISSILAVVLAATGWWISALISAHQSPWQSNTITNWNNSGVVTQGQTGNIYNYNMPQRHLFSDRQKVNTLPYELGGKDTINLDNTATLQRIAPYSLSTVTLAVGSQITKQDPKLHIEGRFVPIERLLAFDLQTNKSHDITIGGRTFTVTLLQINSLTGPMANPIEYDFGISEK